MLAAEEALPPVNGEKPSTIPDDPRPAPLAEPYPKSIDPTSGHGNANGPSDDSSAKEGTSSNGDDPTGEEEKEPEGEDGDEEGGEEAEAGTSTDGAADGAVSSNLAPSSDFPRDSHNRVKLYVLCEQRVWDDRGTGHVAVLPAADNPDAPDPDDFYIIVRLEANEKNVLESKILMDTVYQKQQGTLIVWSETETCDLALSFQEKSGCTTVWNRICRIQGKDPNNEDVDGEDEQEQKSDSSQTSGVSSSLCNSAVTLPSCTLANLTEIEQLLSGNMAFLSQREKMATAIQQSGYVAKLCELFGMCEDLEGREALHQLYSIAKNLFLLNNNGLLTDLLSEEHFKAVVGMLEHDPSSKKPKGHREFLWERSQFNEVLPIHSEELKAKIIQAYRVQYVQDVCLPAPSIFEENLLSALNSHLLFTRSEIVSSLLNDKELMRQLFEELRSPDIEIRRQLALTSFLKEFCYLAHSLQASGPQGKEQFFKTLIANDVLSTIDPCISSPLGATRAASAELLAMIVEFNPQLFRDYLVKQFRTVPETRNDDLLINKLINQMLSDKDPEQTSASQMSQTLRILLDPESIITKGDKNEFLQLFYKRAMHTLCRPIMDNCSEDNAPIKDDYYTANQLSLILEILCFFVDHHGHAIRVHIVQKNLLRSVLVYLKSRHHFLALCALRMLRRVINLKDNVYFNHIIQRQLLDPVVECFNANGPKNNALNSALIECFEYMKTEDIKSLMEYTVEKHWEQTFSQVTYVQTFKQLKQRMDQVESSRQAMKRIKSSSANEEGEGGSPASPPAQWRKEQEYDSDETFFNRDDEEEEEGWYKGEQSPQQQRERESNGGEAPESSSHSQRELPQRKSGVEPLFPSLAKRRKTAEEGEGVASIFGGNITPPISSSSRMSKIVIKMGGGGGGSSNGPISAGVPNISRKLEEAAAGAEEAVVSSSTSSPSKEIASATSTTPCPAMEVDTDTNKSPNPSPVILKKGLSGLVDYDESDDSGGSDGEGGESPKAALAEEEEDKEPSSFREANEL